MIAKQVYLYKYAKELYAQLVSAEEELESEYFDNERFVSVQLEYRCWCDSLG